MVRTVNVPYQPIVHSRIQRFKVDIASGTEKMLMMHLIQYAQSVAPNRPSSHLDESRYVGCRPASEAGQWW